MIYCEPFYIPLDKRHLFHGYSIDGYLPALEQAEIEPQIVSEPLQPEWGKQQWDIVLQIKAEVVGWRQKHSELQLEVERLTKLISSKEKYLYE